MLLIILRITVIKGCIPQLKSEPLRNRKIEPFFGQVIGCDIQKGNF